MEKWQQMVKDNAEKLMAAKQVIVSGILDGKLDANAIQALSLCGSSRYRLPLEGSQSTPRSVSLSGWEKAGKSRIYVNMRIESRTPRDGKFGWIDCNDGAVHAEDSSKATLAEVVAVAIDGFYQNAQSYQ